MAQRVGVRGAALPRPTKRPAPPSTDLYYPGEVAQILGCPELDYAQMRRLYEIVRHQAGEEVAAHQWASFTLRDIAAAAIAVDLAGGPMALRVGRRLMLHPVGEACEGLLALGVNDPLLSVPMLRQGKVVYAVVDGTVLVAKTGQSVLEIPLGPGATWSRPGGSSTLGRVRRNARKITEARGQTQLMKFGPARRDE